MVLEQYLSIPCVVFLNVILRDILINLHSSVLGIWGCVKFHISWENELLWFWQLSPHKFCWGWLKSKDCMFTWSNMELSLNRRAILSLLPSYLYNYLISHRCFSALFWHAVSYELSCYWLDSPKNIFHILRRNTLAWSKRGNTLFKWKFHYFLWIHLICWKSLPMDKEKMFQHQKQQKLGYTYNSEFKM